MNIKKLSIHLLILLGGLMIVNPIIINWLFRIQFFTPLSTYSHYWLHPNLLAGGILVGILMIIIFYVGRLDLKSVFLSGSHLRNAFLPFIIIIIGSNVSVMVMNLLREQPIAFVEQGNVLIGRFAGQLFGNALYEELLFRGIFFIQLYLIFQIKFSRKAALLFALISAEILFALSHIPNRLWVNTPDHLWVNILALFFAGVLLNLIFVFTENLAYMVGIHALANVPFVIFQGHPGDVSIITRVLIILVSISWYVFHGTNQKRWMWTTLFGKPKS